ncbi:DUF998 domain-containing protein [Pseudosporangium ferrugineum]|uniref:Putative membrane protein n=1 Tax=Pseudosporangium ferrugineum TaxID=439699 RepID=A0A2T0RJ31_9ACTN|nr:DUF998 domain-containing protein [Pseudosporangium ferrugineum]PRY21110.1 putative membrane protein [Pseudosporangium ferrugineum]
MNDTSTPVPQRRATVAALLASGGIYFAAEFIAAAAWTDPPYSYTYHYISNLGVHGPSTGFGQYMYSPLAWVMNAGFILFGIVAFAGIATLRGLPGRRRVPLTATAALLTVGVILVGLFPGSGEALEDGTADYHGLGAFAAFISGNVLLILLGRAHRLLGIPRGWGRALTGLGIFGFVGLVAFMAAVSTGANVLVGLCERGAVYPIMIGLIGLGAALRRAGHRVGSLDPGMPQPS